MSRLDVDGIVAGLGDDIRVRYSNYVSYTAEWIDSVTDARMEGFGTEILTVKNGLFNEWIASCSVWRHGDLVKIPGAKAKEAKRERSAG